MTVRNEKPAAKGSAMFADLATAAMAEYRAMLVRIAEGAEFGESP